MAENSESRIESQNIYSNIPPKFDIHQTHSLSSTEDASTASTYGRILPRSGGPSSQGNSFAYCCGETNKYSHGNINFPWDPTQNANSYTLPLPKDMAPPKDISCGLQNTFPKYDSSYSHTMCKDNRNIPPQYFAGVPQPNEQSLPADPPEAERDPVYENIREMQSMENVNKIPSTQSSTSSYLYHKSSEKYSQGYDLSSLTPASCTVVNSPIYANLHEVKNNPPQSYENMQSNMNHNKAEPEASSTSIPSSHSSLPPKTGASQFLGFHVSGSTPVHTYGSAVPKESSSGDQKNVNDIEEISEKMTCVSVTKERKKVSFSNVADDDESDDDDTENHQNQEENTSTIAPPASSIGIFKDDYKPNTLNSKTLLPYNITPPRQKGPTEAEKKIEALMREIEDEMENNPPESEYFGMYLF